MKKFILLITMTVVVVSVYSQGLFQNLVDEYAEQEGFSATQITNDMFDLYIKKKHIPNDSPVYETLKKLDNILIVTQSIYEDEKKNNLNGIHEHLLNHYKKANYSLFKTEKGYDEDLKIYLKKSNDHINSLALVTASSYSISLVEMNGNIDLGSISDLNKALNIRGLENLYKINNSFGSSGYSFSNYGLPYPHYDDFAIKELSEAKRKEIEEMAKQQQVLSEEQRIRFREQAREMTDRNREMIIRQREMSERYRRQPIFLGMPGDTNMVYYLNGKKTEAEVIKKLLPEDIESVEVNRNKEPGGKSVIKLQTKK